MHFFQKIKSNFVASASKINVKIVEDMRRCPSKKLIFNIACITLKEVEVQNFHSALSRTVVIFVIIRNHSDHRVKKEETIGSFKNVE